MRSLLFSLFLFISCTVPDKASLTVSKETKNLRKSPVTLRAQRISELTSDKLEFRQNNSFEYQSILRGTQKTVIYAGTFTRDGDSLSLVFHNDHKDNSWTGKALIDTTRGQVIILSVDPQFNKHLVILPQKS
jgi:hypothetical protein